MTTWRRRGVWGRGTRGHRERNPHREGERETHGSKSGVDEGVRGQQSQLEASGRPCGPQHRGPEVAASSRPPGQGGRCWPSWTSCLGSKETGRRLCQVWWGVGGFAGPRSPLSRHSVHLPVMPKHLDVSGTVGCWEASKNEQVILPANPHPTGFALRLGRQSIDT